MKCSWDRQQQPRCVEASTTWEKSAIGWLFIFTVVVILDLQLEYECVISCVQWTSSSGCWIHDLFHTVITHVPSTYEYRLSACCLLVSLPLEKCWWDARLPLVSMMTVNAGASLGQEVGGPGAEGSGCVQNQLRAEIISHSQTEHRYYWLTSQIDSLLCFMLRKNVAEEHDLRPWKVHLWSPYWFGPICWTHSWNAVETSVTDSFEPGC